MGSEMCIRDRCHCCGISSHCCEVWSHGLRDNVLTDTGVQDRGEEGGDVVQIKDGLAPRVDGQGQNQNGDYVHRDPHLCLKEQEPSEKSSQDIAVAHQTRQPTIFLSHLRLKIKNCEQKSLRISPPPTYRSTVKVIQRSRMYTICCPMVIQPYAKILYAYVEE